MGAVMRRPRADILRSLREAVEFGKVYPVTRKPQVQSAPAAPTPSTPLASPAPSALRYRCSACGATLSLGKIF